VFRPDLFSASAHVPRLVWFCDVFTCFHIHMLLCYCLQAVLFGTSKRCMINKLHR